MKTTHVAERRALPELVVAQIGGDPEIAIVVLAAASDSGGPGPLVTRLMREMTSLPCPLTIVPGDMSKERLEAIT